MARIYIDAATKGNPGESVCSAIIVEEDARHVYTECLGVKDNHSAEWEALLFALEKAKEHKVDNALIYTDSKLIADSIERDFSKNKIFQPYFESFKKIEPYFNLVYVKWIPRAQNKEANHHAQLVLRKLQKKNARNTNSSPN